jgi:acyl dehydratase
MGLLPTDEADIKTLVAPRASQAADLIGGTFATAWFQMDPARADAFHLGTYMDQYAHPYAEDGYGDGLVEGFHLLGMLDYLLNTVLWADGNAIAWNYGLDRARFVTVIRDTDPFRLTGTVRDVIDRGEQGHLLIVEVTGEVQGRTKPGFVATLRLLWSEPDAHTPVTQSLSTSIETSTP